MDKFIVKASKRKKRRTRRNLDEIRKRTLRVHGNNYNETTSRLINPKVTSCITNSRLTLGNKAIRSETITRSRLLNLDKEKSIIALPNKEEAIYTIDKDVNYNKSIIPFIVNSKLKSPLCNFKEIDNNKTTDSIILFSSTESEKMINNITVKDVQSDSSSSASLSFVMHRDNSLYSEFMTNIVNYVQEFPAEFLKTDTVLEANFLQNAIFNKNINFPSNFLTQMNKNYVETKLTNTGLDEAVIDNPKSHNNINIQHSLDQMWNVPTPVFQPSHEMNFRSCISSSFTDFSDKDSPEYFYYPHRLNH